MINNFIYLINLKRNIKFIINGFNKNNQINKINLIYINTLNNLNFMIKNNLESFIIRKISLIHKIKTNL